MKIDWDVLYEDKKTSLNTSERTKNKKMCVICRKYFYRDNMRKNSIGMFCSDCHTKKFGGESRYVKNQLGIQYD